MELKLASIMFKLRNSIRKGLVASVAFASSLRTPLFCQDEMLNLPSFPKLTPKLLEIDVTTEIDVFKSNLGNINSTFGHCSVENPTDSVDILEKASLPLVMKWGVVKHLMGVQNSDDIRKVQSALQGKVISVMQGMNLCICNVLFTD